MKKSNRSDILSCNSIRQHNILDNQLQEGKMEKTNVSTRLYWSSSGQCTTQACTGLAIYTHTGYYQVQSYCCLQGDYRPLVCKWWVLLSWLVMAVIQHLFTSMPWSRLKFLSLAVVKMCRASFTSNSLCLSALST